MSSDASTSILVIHGPTPDPVPFLQRLTSDPSLDLQTKNLWTIDNKYYTAQVHFRVTELKRGQDVTGLETKAVPVVLYLFTDRPPDPLPSILTRAITSEPRDILLAIRVKPEEPSAEQPEDGVRADEEETNLASWDTVEEAFTELGMELVDETQAYEEHTMDPLEEARMTIMTHMWPNMVRKPLGTRSAVDLDFGDDSGDSKYEDGGEEDSEDQVEFPVSFDKGDQGEPSNSPGKGGAAGIGGGGYRDPADDSYTTNLTDQDDDNESLTNTNDDEDPSEPLSLYSKSWAGYTSSSRTAAQAQFPALQALNRDLGETTRMFAQLKVEREMAEERRLERLAKIERDLELDSDDDLSGDEEGEGIRFGQGPDEGEWERLDDWLNGDEAYGALDGGELAGDEQDALDALAALRIASLPQTSSTAKQGEETTADRNPDSARSGRAKKEIGKEGFEDDFADFHSAPPASSSYISRPTEPASKLRLNKNGIPAELPPDPTPLLLHLQNVRAELAGVEDEDERRVRAAREVMAVLGLKGGEDWGLDEGVETSRI